MYELVRGWMETAGYFGIALLMLAENIFPPIPSEIIMPLAGLQAAQGELNIVAVIVSGSLGAIVGTLLWYYLGVCFGLERLKWMAGRYGRWLTVTPKEIERANGWFQRHAGKSVFLGRLVPGVRTLISVPAGIAEMKLRRFLLYSTAGTTLWSGLLALAGYGLGQEYHSVIDWINPLSDVIIGGAIVLYVYRVVTYRPGREAK
jgi:membrane protein DedA with SNARE-associated domain